MSCKLLLHRSEGCLLWNNIINDGMVILEKENCPSCWSRDTSVINYQFDELSRALHSANYNSFTKVLSDSGYSNVCKIDTFDVYISYYGEHEEGQFSFKLTKGIGNIFKNESFFFESNLVSGMTKYLQKREKKMKVFSNYKKQKLKNISDDRDPLEYPYIILTLRYVKGKLSDGFVTRWD